MPKRLPRPWGAFVQQLDLQALHRVRERLVSQRTGFINQIRAFLLERGIAVRKGIWPLRAALPQILTMTDKLSPRMLQIIEALATDWRRLDERIEAVSSEIEALAEEDNGCERLMTVPGIGPIICSATVAAIGTGDVFSNGRDYGAWLGLVCHYQPRAPAALMLPRGDRHDHTPS
jgi:transposase